MASIVLSSAGAAVGSAALGPVGGILGGQLAGQLGGAIDARLFGQQDLPVRQGPRLQDLAVQTSTYGTMIPVLYGTVRIAGNVIWARPIEETATTTTSEAGGKAGGGKVSQSTTTYSYSVTLAIALCEGEIDAVQRVWADSKQLDVSQGSWRLYKGAEDQLPDPLIESFEGVGTTPAYRGLAYVVIEDFPLADYGNRIPNFTFEVQRKVLPAEVGGLPLEEAITAVTLIPGSGEFVYDTQVQYKLSGEQAGGTWAVQGSRERINLHNLDNKANALVALDQLQETLPNLQWVSVVVNWFGDDLDAGQCVIKPGVEFQSGAITDPETWSVAGFTRSTARQITLVDGAPRYGGTPDDESLQRLLAELQARGLKIAFYPLFLMDVADKPWRGRVTGSATDVASFFTKTDGYNAYVTHYANLVKNDVDAFIIGSELIGLTKVADTPGNYPAVNALVSLAASVKTIVGSGVTVTYAADWSEYHHTDGGWYNLDPLWASPNIDVVGIDAYFPLTDKPQSEITLQDAIDGWTSGEGYDWYYTDPERTTKSSLSPAYAWKNIAWWWSNSHTNPDMSTTAWVPESKPVWFTEIGFPSVDGATNQPNVFYDPESSENAFPYHSQGRIDFRAQRLGLLASELVWGGSSMITERFVWTWDARPYPYWPDRLDVWADGANWVYGHWVQGKLGLSGLGAVIADICARCGLDTADIDVSALDAPLEGYVLAEPQSGRAAIETLQQGYFFDAVESDGILKFRPRGGAGVAGLDSAACLPEGEGSRPQFTVTRGQEVELPQRVEIRYLNRLAGYQAGLQLSQRQVTDALEATRLSLPIVFPDQEAKVIADRHLLTAWTQRSRYTLAVPVKYAALEPADIVEVNDDGFTHTVRLTSVRLGREGILLWEGVAEDAASYDIYSIAGTAEPRIEAPQPPGETEALFLDIPALPGDGVLDARLRVAANSADTGWRGMVLYRSDDGGQEYAVVTSTEQAAVTGTAVNALNDGPVQVFDESGSVTVVVRGEGTLASATREAVLSGANLALLGEEIFQFENAVMSAPGKYVLSGLLRGRLGTEHQTGSHAAGERFVLLDGRVRGLEMPLGLLGLPRFAIVQAGQHRRHVGQHQCAERDVSGQGAAALCTGTYRRQPGRVGEPDHRLGTPLPYRRPMAGLYRHTAGRGTRGLRAGDSERQHGGAYHHRPDRPNGHLFRRRPDCRFRQCTIFGIASCLPAFDGGRTRERRRSNPISTEEKT